MIFCFRIINIFFLNYETDSFKREIYTFYLFKLSKNHKIFTKSLDNILHTHCTQYGTKPWYAFLYVIFYSFLLITKYKTVKVTFLNVCYFVNIVIINIVITFVKMQGMIFYQKITVCY